jgi:hypothetical protein
MELYEYIKYFILGGSVTILVNYLVENYKHGPALTAYLYCAPDIYLVIMYIIYKTRGINGYYSFLMHSFINYLANILLIILLIFLTNYLSNIYKSFFIVTVLFILYSIYYFLYVYKLEFTPRHL